MCYICVVYIFLYNDFDFLIFFNLLQEKEKGCENDDHHCSAIHNLLGTLPHSPHAV